MRKPIIKRGDKYNRLTAVRFDHKGGNYRQYWLFKCDCGDKKIIAVNDVKQNRVKSCGCLKKENFIKRITTHGMSYSREYISWNRMKNRCLNKNYENYENWGGRGITVCKRWMKFENFYEDMGKRPNGKYSLDRIDNSKGYSSENCRWATWQQQANNTRRNHWITYNGKTMTIAQWTRELKFKRCIICQRLKRKWSVERALTT